MMETKATRKNLSHKEKTIAAILDEPYVDLWHLRELALSEGGLVNDEFRKRAWPLLVGIDVTDEKVVPRNECTFQPNESGIPSMAEMDQVHRDILRCSPHLLPKAHNKTEEESNLNTQQNRLGDLINIILRNSEGKLQYYQGYHDVTSVFLTVLSEKENLGLSSAVLFQISRSHLRDFMEDDFTSLISAMKLILFPLLSALDPVLHRHLTSSKQGTQEPFFALSWILTWFAHDIRDIALIARIYDAMLSSHPLFIFYLSIAVLMHPYHRRRILRCEDEDFASLHHLLSGLPKRSCPCGVWDEDGGVFLVGDVVEDVGDGVGRGEIVPFQDFIDAAIGYMRYIPPRNILPLASRYKNGILRPLIHASSSISLFLPPPKWALVSETPSDWFLYKRAKIIRQCKAGSLHLPKKANVVGKDSKKTLIFSEDALVPSDDTCDDDVLVAKDLDLWKAKLNGTFITTNSIIAAGIGKGSYDPFYRKHPRVYAVAAAGIFISMVWAWMAYGTSSGTSSGRNFVTPLLREFESIPLGVSK